MKTMISLLVAAGIVCAAGGGADKGSIKIDHASWKAVLVGENKQALKLEGGADAVAVPAGTYRLTEYMEIARSDANGTTLFIAAAKADANKIEVAAGKTTNITAGSPLTVSLEVAQTDKNVSLSLRVSDSAGGALRALAVDGKRPAAPTFEIVDSSGKAVHSGSLEFG